jgi:hypothetical protein
MPSERAAGPLRDILHHIDLAAQFIDGFDHNAFKAALRTVYASRVAWRSSLRHRGVCRMN